MESIFSYLAENFDLPILDWISQHLRSGIGDKLMIAITHLGDAGIAWILLALVMLILPRQRRTGLAMAMALLTGVLLCNVIMKPLFARIRPYDYQLLHYGKSIPLLISAQHDFSFPSGHTLASFEASVPLLLSNKKAGIPALIVACCIAFSRMYLYVHYPTDVLFSVFMGVGIGVLAHKLARKIEHPLLQGKDPAA